MSLSVCLAYHSGDREVTIKWLEHVKRLDALRKHTLYLLPAFDCPPIPEIIPHVALTDYLQVKSNWRSADGVRHACASGPNAAFRTFARHFYDNKLGAFFFCEADNIVLKPESFDKLEEEYLECGKPFMGGYAPAPVPHVNGNMIVPQNAALLTSLMLPMRSDDGTRDIAFDVACAQQVLPQAHCTDLIQHLWRGPSFTSQEDFNTRIRKDAMFYHQCRDNSIYQFLMGGATHAESKPEGSQSAESGSLNGEKVADQPASPALPLRTQTFSHQGAVAALANPMLNPDAIATMLKDGDGATVGIGDNAGSNGEVWQPVTTAPKKWADMTDSEKKLARQAQAAKARAVRAENMVKKNRERLERSLGATSTVTVPGAKPVKRQRRRRRRSMKGKA